MSTETQIPNFVQQHHSRITVSSELAEIPEQLFGPKFRWYVAIRPWLDFVLGLILLTFLSPVIIGGAIAVKLTSPGPAFFCRVCLGRNGRKFTLVKLRTMVHNAEALTGPVWATSNDPRATRLWRFLRNTQIDEFPQLFNVVTGRMGLIGPRPERPEIATSLEWDIPHFRQRLQVRPGITGLSQLVLPADSDIEDVRKKFLTDIYYIRNMNPLLDAQVSFYTLTYLLSASWHGLRHFVRLPCLVRIEQKIASECGLEVMQELCGVFSDGTRTATVMAETTFNEGLKAPAPALPRPPLQVVTRSNVEPVEVAPSVTAREHKKPASGASPTGEIVEIIDQSAICWMDVAPGIRVKTLIPLQSLANVPLALECEFSWSFADDGKTLSFAPLQRDITLDSEFDDLSRNFHAKYADRPLPNDFDAENG